MARSLTSRARAPRLRCDELDRERDEKIRDLFHEYEARKAPHYEARRAAIAPLVHFWRTVLLSCSSIAEYMGPHDDAILEHLIDVRVVAAPASAGNGAVSRPPGYRVEFRFDSAENPFFTDESLWAAVDHDDEDKEITASGVTWTSLDHELSIFELFERPAERAQLSEKELERYEQNHECLREVLGTLREKIWPDPFTMYMQADESQLGVEVDDEEQDDEEGGEKDHCGL